MTASILRAYCPVMLWVSDVLDRFRLERLSNKGQMKQEEYQRIHRAILARRPCNLLVFGRGLDSACWVSANRGGTTTFLEDIAQWNTPLPGASSFLVHYGTELQNHHHLLARYRAGDLSALEMPLPAEVAQKRWDIIIVDGPMGFAPNKPGRMKSIRAARHLCAKGYEVFIHDADRPAEQLYADYFFGHNFQSVRILRHYRDDGTPIPSPVSATARWRKAGVFRAAGEKVFERA